MTALIVPFLAAYRFIRAWFWEDVGEPFRSRADRWLDPGYAVARGKQDWLRVRSWLHGLFSCPYCLGFWVTTAMVICRRIPGLRVLVNGLASAALLCVALDHYPDPSRDTDDDE